MNSLELESRLWRKLWSRLFKLLWEGFNSLVMSVSWSNLCVSTSSHLRIHSLIIRWNDAWQVGDFVRQPRDPRETVIDSIISFSASNWISLELTDLLLKFCISSDSWKVAQLKAGCTGTFLLEVAKESRFGIRIPHCRLAEWRTSSHDVSFSTATPAVIYGKGRYRTVLTPSWTRWDAEDGESDDLSAGELCN